ncbi:MAG: hypothetical protein B7X41_12960 [Microbacterium sp. 14-71-5]|nr:MAG: hypothetical protein B7X32_12695 [Microbacterium sp. 13-71-7]OZB87484.1 MAG: hypothetical protein B7X41_12960 [Microbacterium sp. 14-71-5]
MGSVRGQQRRGVPRGNGAVTDEHRDRGGVVHGVDAGIGERLLEAQQRAGADDGRRHQARGLPGDDLDEHGRELGAQPAGGGQRCADPVRDDLEGAGGDPSCELLQHEGDPGRADGQRQHRVGAELHGVGVAPQHGVCGVESDRAHARS